MVHKKVISEVENDFTNEMCSPIFDTEESDTENPPIKKEVTVLQYASVKISDKMFEKRLSKNATSKYANNLQSANNLHRN